MNYITRLMQDDLYCTPKVIKLVLSMLRSLRILMKAERVEHFFPVYNFSRVQQAASLTCRSSFNFTAGKHEPP